MPDYVDIDAVDERIIELVQKHARISNRELADQIGLSPSATLARMRLLRERGVITGFAASVDLAKLGRPLQAMIAIRLHTHERATLDTLVDRLAALDETLSLFHLTGEADYLLHVAVQNPDHLRNLVLDELTSRPEIAQVTTSLVFEHHKAATIGRAHRT